MAVIASRSGRYVNCDMANDDRYDMHGILPNAIEDARVPSSNVGRSVGDRRHNQGSTSTLGIRVSAGSCICIQDQHSSVVLSSSAMAIRRVMRLWIRIWVRFRR